MNTNYIKRPSFSDLSADERKHFGNGVGPYWLSDRCRALITKTASWFFKNACWRHHDFGYAVGGDRFDRARGDWRFFIAMLKDAMSSNIFIAPLAVTISAVFYISVRIGGGWGSFKYRNAYASISVILKSFKPKR